MNSRNILQRWADRRRHRDEDLSRELESHIDLESAEQRDGGLSPEQARYAAQRAFGNPTLTAEDVRETWGFARLDRFVRDLRYGARSLARSPGFTAVAVLTLALGIGANTAIFSVINALVLRPVPFSTADRIVRITSTKDGAPVPGYADGAYAGGPSATDVKDFAESSKSFEKFVVYDAWRKNVSFGASGSLPEEMNVGLVPPDYFEILDVKPFAGRLFTPDECHEGKNYVAAISVRLWNERFSGDRDILSRKIIINDESYSIIAVMPDVIPQWVERAKIDVWTPLPFSDIWSESARGSRGWGALGLLKSGASFETARSELTAIAARLANTYPVDEGIGVDVKKLADTRAGAMRSKLFLLMGAVVLILLIACVNLGNLLLARGAARGRELTLRAALGAGRGRLLAQLLAETLLLSLAGGAAGLVLAQIGIAGIERIEPKDLAQMGTMGIDWRVVGFTFIAALVTTLVFGLAPALTSTRLNLIDALNESGRSGASGPASRRLRGLLVVAEMAMSLVLLVGASLLIQSIVRLEHTDLGVSQDHLLKGHLYIPPAHYPNAQARTKFCDELGNR
ncbi:MAG TPA: ABC transporter permease, partial [Blastocatellia bacterium]